MNLVILKGNLGQNPELKVLNNEQKTAVCNFSLATKAKRGEVAWHNCKAFGVTAETIEKYLSKGSEVLVEGEIAYRTWEKDGQKRYATDIVVNRFHFCGKKEQGQQPPQHQMPQGDDYDVPF